MKKYWLIVLFVMFITTETTFGFTGYELGQQALTHQVGGPGNTCKEFVKTVVRGVGGTLGTGYRDCYLAVGYKISLDIATYGDVGQISYDPDPTNENHVHSFMVLGRLGEGKYNVIHSNWCLDDCNTVSIDDINPQEWARDTTKGGGPGWNVHFYRLADIIGHYGDGWRSDLKSQMFLDCYYDNGGWSEVGQTISDNGNPRYVHPWEPHGFLCQNTTKGIMIYNDYLDMVLFLKGDAWLIYRTGVDGRFGPDIDMKNGEVLGLPLTEGDEPRFDGGYMKKVKDDLSHRLVLYSYDDVEITSVEVGTVTITLTPQFSIYELDDTRIQINGPSELDYSFYDVYVDGAFYARVNVAQGDLVITDLSPDTYYNIEVIAFDASGNELVRNGGMVKTRPSEVVVPATITLDVNQGMDTAMADWTCVSGSSYYWVYLSDVEYIETTSCSHSFDQLEQNTSYCFHVEAYDSASNLLSVSNTETVITGQNFYAQVISAPSALEPDTYYSLVVRFVNDTMYHITNGTSFDVSVLEGSEWITLFTDNMADPSYIESRQSIDVPITFKTALIPPTDTQATFAVSMSADCMFLNGWGASVSVTHSIAIPEKYEIAPGISGDFGYRLVGEDLVYDVSLYNGGNIPTMESRSKLSVDEGSGFCEAGDFTTPALSVKESWSPGSFTLSLDTPEVKTIKVMADSTDVMNEWDEDNSLEISVEVFASQAELDARLASEGQDPLAQYEKIVLSPNKSRTSYEQWDRDDGYWACQVNLNEVANRASGNRNYRTLYSYHLKEAFAQMGIPLSQVNIKRAEHVLTLITKEEYVENQINNSFITSWSDLNYASWLSADGTVPWENPGGDFDWQTTSTITIPADAEWGDQFVWDVTDIARQALNSSLDCNLLAWQNTLQEAGENNLSLRFASYWHPDVPKRPFIKLYFTAGSEPAEPVIDTTTLSIPATKVATIEGIWDTYDGGVKPLENTEAGCAAFSIFRTSSNVLLDIPFNQIPANCQIVSATLELTQSYENEYSQNIFYANAVEQPWEDASWSFAKHMLYWAMPGGTYSQTNQVQTEVPSYYNGGTGPIVRPIRWDVTELVQNVRNGDPYYGFLIRQRRFETGSDIQSVKFFTNYYEDASKHPKLVIQYIE